MKHIEIDLTFPSNFGCQVLTELPNGDHHHFYYPGGNNLGGKNGLLIRVSPDKGNKWIGTFAHDITYENCLNKIVSWMNPDKICVVSSGIGFLVNVNEPAKYETLEGEPIFYLIPVLDKDMVIFSNHTTIVAYNKDGKLWETERISWDRLKIFNVGDSHVEGSYWNVRNNTTAFFKVDLSNGRVEGNTINSSLINF